MAEGGAMEELVELAWLLDFYGALLTEKRRRIVEMRVNEDMTLAEIADACQTTRSPRRASNSRRMRQRSGWLGGTARSRRRWPSAA